MTIIKNFAETVADFLPEDFFHILGLLTILAVWAVAVVLLGAVGLPLLSLLLVVALIVTPMVWSFWD